MPSSYNVAQDTFAASAPGRDTPASRAVAVVPSDTADLAEYAKALRIHAPGASTVRVTPLRAADDADTVTLDIPAGLTVEPLAVRRVWATGTGATLKIHAYLG